MSKSIFIAVSKIVQPTIGNMNGEVGLQITANEINDFVLEVFKDDVSIDLRSIVATDIINNLTINTLGAGNYKFQVSAGGDLELFQSSVLVFLEEQEPPNPPKDCCECWDRCHCRCKCSDYRCERRPCNYRCDRRHNKCRCSRGCSDHRYD